MSEDTKLELMRIAAGLVSRGTATQITLDTDDQVNKVIEAYKKLIIAIEA